MGRLRQAPFDGPARVLDYFGRYTHGPVRTFFCDYNVDPAGERAAELLSLRHPGIRRLRPPHAKDWNELLQSQP